MAFYTTGKLYDNTLDLDPEYQRGLLHFIHNPTFSHLLPRCRMAGWQANATHRLTYP